MASQANQPLPQGHALENYRILRVLASGGFSFVYLAHDENDAPVAIKEYLPAGLALRANGAALPQITSENLAAFRFGMKSFFEEGRALAGLAHPNVVRVLNFFRANETVYLVMRYERGRTLAEHIRARGGVLHEPWIRHTFAQLLNGLREVHAHKLLHLDIKPGNVYVRNDGAPVLIDFGAARQTLTGGAAKLPPMYTPGYASPEHHGQADKLGPWSDVYSVGATLYACICGNAPPSAAERQKSDTLQSAHRAAAAQYSKELLDIIDCCLRLDALERPQSVFALQKVLLAEPGSPPKADGALVGQLKGAWRRLSGGGGRA
jgi:hypothetical protein